jgi:hypothetical protein
MRTTMNTQSPSPSRLRRPGPSPAVSAPLPAPRKWRAITVATLLLVPGFWALLTALVALAVGGRPNGGDRTTAAGAPDVGAALALGLALVPFAFVALAWLSEHPRPPVAVLRAMGLALVVGIPVSALAGDAVTGLVAGIGAGGIAALRADPPHRLRYRVVAVVLATAYTFALARVAAALALLPAPVFPFTALGVADHFAERTDRRHEQAP